MNKYWNIRKGSLISVNGFPFFLETDVVATGGTDPNILPLDDAVVDRLVAVEYPGPAGSAVIT